MLTVLFTLFSGFYNWAACIVIKHQTAVNRNISDQVRVIVVWTFFWNYSGLGHENFSIEKFLGFMMIVAGVLGFNNVYSVSVCKRKDNDKAKEGVDKSWDSKLSQPGVNKSLDSKL